MSSLIFFSLSLSFGIRDAIVSLKFVLYREILRRETWVKILFRSEVWWLRALAASARSALPREGWGGGNLRLLVEGFQEEANLLEWQITTSTRFLRQHQASADHPLARSASPPKKTPTRAAVPPPWPVRFPAFFFFFLPLIGAREEWVNCLLRRSFDASDYIICWNCINKADDRPSFCNVAWHLTNGFNWTLASGSWDVLDSHRISRELVPPRPPCVCECVCVCLVHMEELEMEGWSVCLCWLDNNMQSAVLLQYVEPTTRCSFWLRLISRRQKGCTGTSVHLSWIKTKQPGTSITL